MSPTNSGINELHAAYVEHSGMDLALRFNRESSWTLFTQEGFTKADLIAVIDRLKRLVQAGERRPECLKFSNVVEGLDRFEEELAMIKAEAAGLKPAERPMSVFDLQRILDCKIRWAEELSIGRSTQDTFGRIWDNAQDRERHRTLIDEIRQLRIKISSMA
jgi:hypothetical protein